MTDEFKLNQAIGDAARAAELMRDEMLQTSFEGLIGAYMKAWRNSIDADERERCWHRVQALDEIRARLAFVVQGGRIAQAELDKIAETQRVDHGG